MHAQVGLREKLHTFELLMGEPLSPFIRVPRPHAEIISLIGTGWRLWDAVLRPNGHWLLILEQGATCMLVELHDINRAMHVVEIQFQPEQERASAEEPPRRRRRQSPSAPLRRPPQGHEEWHV